MNIESKSTKGITLIEVLVIVAIILLVGAGIYQIFANKNTDTENKNEQKKEEVKVKTENIDVKVGDSAKREKEDQKDIKVIDATKEN